MKYFKFNRLFSVNLNKLISKSAKLSVLCLPFLFATAFAYPVTKLTNGKSFYTNTAVVFQFKTEEMPFAPVKLDFWGDYYTSSSKRTFDIVQGYLFLDGQQAFTVPNGLSVAFASNKKRLPYFCFYKYDSFVSSEPVSQQRACYTYDSNSGSLPSESYLDIRNFSAGLPDYTVTYKEAPPYEVNAGESFTIRTTFKNVGSGSADRVASWNFFFKQGSRIFDSQYDFGSVDVPLIPSGGFKDYELTFSVPVDTEEGTYYVYSDVDFGNRITELDEQNNRFFFNIRVKGAPQGCTNQSASNYDINALIDNGSCVFNAFDLAMGSATVNGDGAWARNIDAGGYLDFIPTDDFYLRFSVDNLGDSRTPPTNAAIFVNPVDAPYADRFYKNQIGTVYIPGIDAGDYKYPVILDWDVPQLDSGTYVLSWFIDRINTVYESNETNNKDFFVFTVSGGNGTVVDIPGCTNSAADNYNTSATVDDGTCYYSTDSGSDGNVDYTQNTAATDGILAGVGQSENTTAGQNIIANLPEAWTDFDFSSYDQNTINDVQLNLSKDPDEYFFEASCGEADYFLKNSTNKITNVFRSGTLLKFPRYTKYNLYDSSGNWVRGSWHNGHDISFNLKTFVPGSSSYVDGSQGLPNGDYTLELASSSGSYNVGTYVTAFAGKLYGYKRNCFATIPIEVTDDLISACTDPTATNFNQNAHLDDGSCRYPVLGCVDPNSSSYNPSATVSEPSSCTYVPTLDSSAGFLIQDGYEIPVNKQFTVNYWFNEEDLGYDVDEVRFFKNYQQAGIYKAKDIIDGWNDVDQTGHHIYDSYPRTGVFVPRVCFIGYSDNKSTCVFADGKTEARLSQAVTVIEDDAIEGCINPQADNYNPYATISTSDPDLACNYSGSDLQFINRKFQSLYNVSEHEIYVDFRYERVDGSWIENFSYPSLGAQPSIDYRAYVCYSRPNPDISITSDVTCEVLDSFTYNSSSGYLVLDLNESMQAVASSCDNQQVFISYSINHLDNSNDRIEMNFYNSWYGDQNVDVSSSYCSSSSSAPVFGDPESQAAGVFSFDNINLDLPDDTHPFVRTLIKGWSLDIPYIDWSFSLPGLEGFLRGLVWLSSFLFSLLSQVPFVGDFSSIFYQESGVVIVISDSLFGLDLPPSDFPPHVVSYGKVCGSSCGYTEAFVWILLTLFFLINYLPKFFK